MQNHNEHFITVYRKMKLQIQLLKIHCWIDDICVIAEDDPVRTRGERIVFWWPNTNTNIIRLPKNYRIRIRILFGFPKMTEYEYEYYSASQKWPNTNTNIIRLPENDRIRIRILFGFPKMTEYEYYSDSQKYIAGKSQTNANSVSMQSCMHTIQVYIWIHKVGKMFTNAKNVILHFWSKKFEGAFGNAQTNATIASMHSIKQETWGCRWKCTVGKS